MLRERRTHLLGVAHCHLTFVGADPKRLLNLVAGFVLQLSKVEAFFILIAAAILAGIAWSFANSGEQIGPDQLGVIRACRERLSRSNLPWVCSVQLSDGATVKVFNQIYRVGDHVIVAEMRYRLSRRVYYTVVRRDDPTCRRNGLPQCA